MGMKGDVFQFQKQSLIIDRKKRLDRQKREAREGSDQIPSADALAAKNQISLEDATSVTGKEKVLHPHLQETSLRNTGSPESPMVFKIHRHEGGYVEVLLKGEGVPRPGRISHFEHIGFSLVPGSIRDLGHQMTERGSVRIKTIIETHRIEAKTEVRNLGQKTDRSRRSNSGFGLHPIPNGFIQGGLASKVGIPIEADQAGKAVAEKKRNPEEFFNLRQFQIKKSHLIAEVMDLGRGSPVVERPFEKSAS